MDSNLPRVLMLILSSDTNPIYIKFQEIWRTIMNSHPNIDCYFYKGNSSQEEEYRMIDKNTLSIRIDDGCSMIYEKMRMAFSFFKNDLHKYDFVCRPNISSFIAFDNYLKTLSSIQSQKETKTKFCYASIFHYGDLQFASGAAFTISTDIVEYIINTPRPKYIEDDVTVGLYLREMGVVITPALAGSINTEQDAEILNRIDIHKTDLFHFRLKTYGNREKDLEHFKRLIEIYYLKK